MSRAGRQLRSRLLPGRVIAVMSFVSATLGGSMSVGAGRATVIFKDDFEKTNVWTFSSRGLTGEQQLDKAVFHGGKRALSAVTDRFELMNHRGGLKFTESRALLSFWCYADYEAGDEFWTRIMVGATREGKAQPAWLTLKPPTPRRWEQREMLLEEISPSLAGASVSQLHIGLRGRGTTLKLIIDDVVLENRVPESLCKERASPVRPPSGPVGPLAWAAKEKVRAIYVVPKPNEGPRYRDLFQAPINTVFLGSQDSGVVVEWAARCASYAKHLYLVLPAFPAMEGMADAKSLRRAQFADTIEDNVICPREPRFWERQFQEAMDYVAGLAKLVRIEGCLLDLRLPNNAKHRTYSLLESCLCDDCFDAFLKSKKSLERAAFIPLFDRRGFLMRKGWLREYSLWEEGCMIDLARDAARKLRERHPEFVLGIFAYEDFWLARGLATGFAATGVPSMIVSAEPARTEGYNLRVREMTDTVRHFGFPSFFVPGLSPDMLDTRQLPDHLLRAGIGADGFWITVPPPDQRDAIAQLGDQVTVAVGKLRDTLDAWADAKLKSKK